MAYVATTPTSTAAFGNVSRTGDSREAIARETEACSAYVVGSNARKGLIPTSGATDIGTASTSMTLALASGCLRTISSVGVSGGVTIAIQTTGAVQGQRFRLCKIATGGAGNVTVDGRIFLAHFKFNAELSFVNGAWRLVGLHDYLSERAHTTGFDAGYS